MIRLPAIGLRGRLAVSIALIMAVALGITYVAVYRGTGSDLRDQTDADLAREAGNLSRSMAAPPPLDTDEYTVRARRLVRAQPYSPASRLIAISVAGGGTASNQPELLGLPSGTMPAGNRDTTPEDGERESDESGEREREGRESDDSGEGRDDDRESAARLLTSGSGFSTLRIEDVGDVRLLTNAVSLPGGGAATVRVGQPLAPVDRALDGLSRTFLVVGLLTLLLATAAGWFLASRTARPIRRMAGVAEGVDGGELSARMPIAETRNDEVRRLAESFNLMLDRLEAAFTGQRAFVADASHDLRTPLTIIKGQLDVLSRDPDPDPEDVQRVTGQVKAATARMEKLVEDLLLLARTDSGLQAELGRAELEPLLTAEVEAFSETSDRRIELGDVTDRAVSVDRERMARAVSNLIANAIAHTSGNGRIEVGAVETAGGVEITVDDDGPGVPAAMRERIFDRFARLDSSRSSDSGGSGLGLAIVKAVAELHGGTATCGDSRLGGARFAIVLPAD